MNVGQSNLDHNDPNATLLKRGELLNAYDNLPARLRELYDSAPVPFNPIEWQQVIAAYGPERAYLIVEYAIKQQYPGWSPVVRRTRRGS